MDEILIAARALIAHPSNWMQGHMVDGTRYCLWGAIMTASHHPHTYPTALYRLQQTLGTPYITLFNDTHIHAEVIQAITPCS